MGTASRRGQSPFFFSAETIISPPLSASRASDATSADDGSHATPPMPTRGQEGICLIRWRTIGMSQSNISRGEEQPSKQGPPEEDLDALRHHAFHQTRDDRGEIGRRGRHPHTVYILGTTGKTIGHVVFHAVGVERSTHQPSHKHVQDIEYRECLEEMLKRHHLVQTPHEGDTEDGIGESTTHQRYAEHLDIQPTVEQDIVSTHIEGRKTSARRQ